MFNSPRRKKNGGEGRGRRRKEKREEGMQEGRMGGLTLLIAFIPSAPKITLLE